MDLPLAFEGNPPTGSVFDFVTNEVCKYYHPAVGFYGISPNAPQPIPINIRMKASLVWWSPVFHDKINFYVESGNTNCDLSSALVTNAASIHAEWNERSALAASAEQFLQSISSGSITNLPSADLRLRNRTASQDGNGLVPIPDSELSDRELRDMFSEISSKWAFEPICLMELSRQPLGTNEVWFLPVRTDHPTEQDYARDISPLPLVFFDGVWSFLY
jgi:hypothetical protein